MESEGFQLQGTHEKVILRVGKHWLVFVKIGLVVGAVSAVLLLGLVQFFQFLFTGNAAALNWIYLIETFIALGLWFWAFQSWIDEEFDAFILTNERLIDVTQTGLFRISFAETNLELIQNTKGRNQGFLGNILNFGTLEIKTAANNAVLEIENIPDPVATARRITAVQESYVEAGGIRAIEAETKRAAVPAANRSAIESVLVDE